MNIIEHLKVVWSRYLGDLCGLARTRLSNNDSDAVFGNGVENCLPERPYWQLLYCHLHRQALCEIVDVKNDLDINLRAEAQLNSHCFIACAKQHLLHCSSRKEKHRKAK